MLEQKMRRYYRQIMFGNRSLFARTVDFVALRVIMFIALLLWFSVQTANTLLSLILSAVATGMVCVVLALFKNIKLDKFVARKRLELTRDHLLEQMVLMPRNIFIQMMASMARHVGYSVQRLTTRGVLCQTQAGEGLMIFAFQNHPNEPLTAEQLLSAYRYLQAHNLEHGILAATAPLSDNAKALWEKLGDEQLVLWGRAKLLSLAQQLDLLPDAQEVEQALLEELEQKRLHLRRFKKQAIAMSRVRPYLVCGVVLFCASIITGQHLYYPIMGAIYFFMAFLCYFLDGNKRHASPE